MSQTWVASGIGNGSSATDQLSSIGPHHEGKEMRTRYLALLPATTALGASPRLAQTVEQVRPVFEHAIPNAKGKRHGWSLRIARNAGAGRGVRRSITH